MANNIESIEIFPGENGGHRVVHNFKREPSKKEGSKGGGIYMERPKAPKACDIHRTFPTLLTIGTGCRER